MENENILSENEVVELLVKWLQNDNWIVKKKALGYQHGNDIEAERNGEQLIIEAKGIKPNDSKKSHIFNNTQIQVHFGKALIKIMEEQTKNPSALTGIAQPNDETIKQTLKFCLPQVKKLNIILFWVNQDGEIIVE
ncbi:MAG: hypothetical protein KatS3mg002_1667 [Candidatus Woesearchaeota archaeon]|nr:MAG: hypothetical protein KatS3mg002_1667 [Candidatus Woesearchaeota archaeon]